ncbi:monosaccharide ABC transporter substrate-binding protein (CUT2 family) /monosaccharide ABC transporter membrane protein (CUT2 family) [Haloactinospora alba]|uniref:Monosaccharide ABC transporter substrate-binding protein (CUT2 family) /monosaccharide ABC transporter membrane protein (CUT2 family) n=1 Tax=Haloactinospora alba TaxID=405555 RepID=A0A543NIC9_9ACTN|nr:substrate-binding domain-containing protein [Haloactinospora alba]TQN31592.1 monosaccharide ABC transporter substrate-binding protein (CUT2 family) /monosaccharide ABC transporter membrane protein (CUT2 family) [Haloactinospora alba]
MPEERKPVGRKSQPPGPGRTAAVREGRNWLRSLARDNGALVGLVALVALLSVLSPDFLTLDNLLNVGVQASVVAILAFGLTFVIVSGGIDLSVGSVAGLAGIVTGWAIASGGLPIWVAVLVGLGAGAAAGAVSGLLVTLGRVPPFIATLAMLSIARGLALVISDGKPITFDGWLAELGSGTLFGVVPYPVIVMLAIALMTAVVLRRTYSGRAMYAIGGNTEAARLSGIKVGRQQLAVFALSGLFAAVAGVLLASRLASAQPEAGDGYELDAIAAVVIGGASLSGGVGSATGTFVGALILGVLRNGLNLLNVSAFWQEVIIGVVIAVAVLSDTLRRNPNLRLPSLLRTPGVRRAAAVLVVALLMAGGAFGYQRYSEDSTGTTTIAVSVSTLNNPFFVDLRDAARAEAREHDIELIVTDAGNDSSQQVDSVNNAIAQNADAIIVNPVDSDAIVPAVEAANQAEIPFIAVDRSPSDGTVTTTIASDNVEGGREGAREIADLVGSGEIAVLEGQPGTSAARDRGKGFSEEIEQYSDIEVVASQPADFDRTEALNVTQNLVQANPGIEGIFAANDEMALGAAKALGDKAGDEVKIVGFDGTPDGLDAVENGTQNATVAQQPKELGRQAVQEAVTAAAEQDLGPGEPIAVPVTVVDKDNLAAFREGE